MGHFFYRPPTDTACCRPVLAKQLFDASWEGLLPAFSSGGREEPVSLGQNLAFGKQTCPHEWGSGAETEPGCLTLKRTAPCGLDGPPQFPSLWGTLSALASPPLWDTASAATNHCGGRSSPRCDFLVVRGV